MTSEAVHTLVLPEQGIPSFRVIEFFVYVVERNTLPAASAMAGLAGLSKATLVRIGVTVGALAEDEPHVTWLVVGTRSVALLTRNLRVQSGQRIPGFGVVELCDIFPVFKVVALLTIGAETAVVLVLVAGRASLRQT